MNTTPTQCTHDCANCPCNGTCEIVIVEDEIPKPSTQLKILEATESVAAMLIQKNQKYGDAALKPLNIFSKDTAANSLLVRVDDKLSRISNNVSIDRDDVMDLIGYLVLILIDCGWEGYEGNVEKL